MRHRRRARSDDWSPRSVQLLVLATTMVRLALTRCLTHSLTLPTTPVWEWQAPNKWRQCGVCSTNTWWFGNGRPYVDEVELCFWIGFTTERRMHNNQNLWSVQQGFSPHEFLKSRSSSSELKTTKVWARKPDNSKRSTTSRDKSFFEKKKEKHSNLLPPSGGA